MIQHIDLRDGGALDYHDAFYVKDVADAFFARLRAETPWRQEQSRFGPFPRLTAWYADSGLTYSYSGVTHHGIAWTEALARIRCDVEAAANESLPSPLRGRGAGGEGGSFNSLLLNLYRDGQDSIGYHTDDEPELGVNPVIASISFGAARQFHLKHKKTREKLTLELAHGSLLIMGGTCQHHWMHGIPKTKTPVGERINLTFRKIGERPA